MSAGFMPLSTCLVDCPETDTAAGLIYSTPTRMALPVAFADCARANGNHASAGSAVAAKTSLRRVVIRSPGVRAAATIEER